MVTIKLANNLAALRDLNKTSDFQAAVRYQNFILGQFASEPANGFDSCINNSSDPLWPRCADLSKIQENKW
jgi:hypothetical protein